MLKEELWSGSESMSIVKVKVNCQLSNSIQSQSQMSRIGEAKMNEPPETQEQSSIGTSFTIVTDRLRTLFLRINYEYMDCVRNLF